MQGVCPLSAESDTTDLQPFHVQFWKFAEIHIHFPFDIVVFVVTTLVMKINSSFAKICVSGIICISFQFWVVWSRVSVSYWFFIV